MSPVHKDTECLTGQINQKAGRIQKRDRLTGSSSIGTERISFKEIKIVVQHHYKLEELVADDIRCQAL